MAEAISCAITKPPLGAWWSQIYAFGQHHQRYENRTVNNGLHFGSGKKQNVYLRHIVCLRTIYIVILYCRSLSNTISSPGGMSGKHSANRSGQYKNILWTTGTEKNIFSINKWHTYCANTSTWYLICHTLTPMLTHRVLYSVAIVWNTPCAISVIQGSV